MFLGTRFQNLLTLACDQGSWFTSSVVSAVPSSGPVHPDGLPVWLVYHSSVNCNFHDIYSNSFDVQAGDYLTMQMDFAPQEAVRLAFGHALNNAFGGGANFPSANLFAQSGTLINLVGGATASSIERLDANWLRCKVEALVTSSFASRMYVRLINSLGLGTYPATDSSGIYTTGFIVTKTRINSPMPFVRTVNSAEPQDFDFVDLDPINFARNDEVIQNTHRMKAGNGFRYVWGRQSRVKFGAQVSSEVAAIVNSWWAAGTPLMLSDEFATSRVSSCYITNKTAPFASFKSGANTMWVGTIELEGY